MPLDCQRIVSDAFAVLNEVGLDGLTLRRLAARLDVKAPAIYWHFKSKQALLDEMATEVLRRAMCANAALESLLGWQEWAAAYYSGLRNSLLQFRDGAKMFSGTYRTDTDLYAPMEASLRRMAAAGFTLRQAVVGLKALYSYTIGFVIEEQALQFAPGEPNPQYNLAERERRVNRKLHPLASAAGEDLFMQQGSSFAEGIGLIIAGLAAQLGQNPGTV